MKYRSHVFDMDGVCLDSNGVKSSAFYETALTYGEDAALAMVTYHQQAGSISRRQRWQDFFSLILKREPEEGEVDKVLDECSAGVAKGMANAGKVPGLESYLKTLKGAKIVVSGAEQEEVRALIQQHGLAHYFDAVYGGTKVQLKSERLIDLVLQGKIKPPAVYYGDTEDDYMAATHAQFDFVFVSGCSEFSRWRTFFADKHVKVIENFCELLPSEVVA